MKQQNKVLPSVVLIGFTLFGINNAEAYNSEFSGSAKIDITVNAISNVTNSGSIFPAELTIFGGVYPQPDNSYYAFKQDGSVLPILSGNAVLNDSNAPVVAPPLPLSLVTSFSHTFSVHGYANDGDIDSYSLGLYGIGISNSSLTDTYQVDFDFSYLLSAYASAQNGGLGAEDELNYATAQVTLDYFSDEDSNFFGYAFADNYSSPGVYQPTEGNTGQFSITLTPGATVYYLADATITGNLTAVPLPSAAWLFLSGIFGVLGLKKRRAFVA
jgi:hypothetical protein